MISAIVNNMFTSAIFRHNPPYTDFLLVWPHVNKNQLLIRDLPVVYTVAQEQPTMEVPAPNSRAANAFIKNRMRSYIVKLFATSQKVRITDVAWAFPDQSETCIRKRLKEVADFQRTGDDSGHWTLRTNLKNLKEQQSRQNITPEMVCAYESMCAGQQRLIDAGVTTLTVPAGVNEAIAQFDEHTDPAILEAAAAIEEELKLTPWNLTSNFISAMNGRATLTLTGFGDPSGIGEGFSYMLAPPRGSKEAKKQQPQIQLPRASVTGTDADLRKLSLEDTTRLLRDSGVPGMRSISDCCNSHGIQKRKSMHSDDGNALT